MTASRSPLPRPARLSSQASWLAWTSMSRYRTGSAGSLPFSKTNPNRSGSASARAAMSLPSTETPRAWSTYLDLENVDAAGGRVCAHPSARVLGQGQTGVWDLPLATPPLQLPGHLDRLGGPGGADR